MVSEGLKSNTTLTELDVACDNAFLFQGKCLITHMDRQQIPRKRSKKHMRSTENQYNIDKIKYEL